MKAMTVTEINIHLVSHVKSERKISFEVISYICLFEKCGGYLKMGYSSMHENLTRGLSYSNDQV